MFYSCQWNGLPCNMSESFTSIWTDVGRCYTFNSGLQATDTGKVSVSSAKLTGFCEGYATNICEDKQHNSRHSCFLWVDFLKEICSKSVKNRIVFSATFVVPTNRISFARAKWLSYLNCFLGMTENAVLKRQESSNCSSFAFGRPSDCYTTQLSKLDLCFMWNTDLRSTRFRIYKHVQKKKKIQGSGVFHVKLEETNVILINCFQQVQDRAWGWPWTLRGTSTWLVLWVAQVLWCCCMTDNKSLVCVTWLLLYLQEATHC